MEEELLHRVVQDPEDLGHRQVYSDFLQENDPARAACFAADLAFAAAQTPDNWMALAKTIGHGTPEWRRQALHPYDVWKIGSVGRLIHTIRNLRRLTKESLRESKRRAEQPNALAATRLDGARAEALRRFLARDGQGTFEIRPAAAKQPPLGPSTLRADVVLTATPPVGLVASVLQMDTKRAERLGPMVATDLPYIDALLLSERLLAAGAKAQCDNHRYPEDD